MKIYVASSWRNTVQPAVVARLRAEGHDVYDFKNPQGDGPGTGFAWASIDPNWRTWTPAEYLLALTHAKAQAGFESDERGMVRADACVLVLPAGRSAHVEFGWMLGRGQLGYVLLSEEGFDPDLMYLLTPHRNICLTLDELVGKIAGDADRLASGDLRPEYNLHTLRPTGRSLRSSAANPNFSNLSKKLDGSPARPPIMPHVVTSPKERVVDEVVIEGGVCELEVPRSALVKMFKFLGAADGPEPGDEYNVVSLATGRSLLSGTADDCRAALAALGYEPAGADVVAAVLQRYTLGLDDEVWVNPAEVKKFDQWFEAVKQYLP